MQNHRFYFNEKHGSEKYKERIFASKDLRGLQQTFCLAEKVGEELGRCKILQRQMQIEQT